jgi:Ca-activated chloride channel family protein
MTVGGIVQDVKVPVEIDEETLKKIAETTDGHYYRATNTKELKQIYKDIDKLEKTKLEAKKYRKFYDAYLPFAIVAFCMLLLELILRTTVLKREP